MKRMTALLIAALLPFAAGPVSGHVGGEQPIPLDFITGGGWFIIQPPTAGTSPGNRANFGWHGGVKNGDWWGNGNYIDHGTGLHVRSTEVTGYVRIGTDGTDPQTGQPTGTRDVCGIATTNQFGTVRYRVRMKDNGEPGRQDKFGISLFVDAGQPVYFAWGSLGDPTDGGGNIQLHKGNNSNTAPETPADCPDDYFTPHAFS
ncbi:MAG: hypothetical protein HY317_04995 [Acidobacteria bacterium]|nr:hypothetical protein [Acidobacteriota bacterium]